MPILRRSVVQFCSAPLVRFHTALDKEIFAAIFELHLRRKSEEEWVRRQVEGMLELPDILYKYVPCKSPSTTGCRRLCEQPSRHP